MEKRSASIMSIQMLLSRGNEQIEHRGLIAQLVQL